MEVPIAENNVPSPQQATTPETTFHQTITALNELAQAHQLPNHRQEIVTPVKADQLERLLQNYDTEITKFLVNGFTFGFKIPYYGPRNPRQSHYSKPDTENIAILKQKIQKELDTNRVAGPFVDPPFPNLQISPFGLVPKKVPGEFRLIHNLSFPDNKSINDGIPREFCSVQYQNIDNAVALIKRFGKGCLLSKTDLENAFRIIPLSPADYELMGFVINNQYFYDRTLPQGLSHSCFLFEIFSTSLQWIAEQKLKIPGCAHILDDFLFVGPPNYQKCLADLNKFLDMAKVLGVPIKSEKTVLPCTTISFVGIEVDSVLMEKRLPSDKLEKIRKLLHSFKHKKKATLLELQSLIGLLNFACSVVTPGRPFLRRLIDLTIGLSAPHHRRRLNKEAKADLHAWSVFIEHFNGKSVFLPDQWITSDIFIQIYIQMQVTLDMEDF